MANSLETILRNGKNVMANTTPMFRLPNGGGSYANPAASNPLFAGATPPAITPPPVAPPAPAPTTPPARSKYINPATGSYFTPQEYANYVALKIPAGKGTGDIPQYAGDAMTNPGESAAGLNTRATNLNNTRNDIATGTTDPYKVGNKSGIAYSPQELSAIEKAYAGIYDPALNDVFARLKTKEEADKLAADQAWEKEKLALQHGYAMEEKGLTGGGAGGGAGAGYVPGADPIVDSYVERINRGELASDVFKNIPGVANQALRDKVSAGMMATKYESAKALGSLDTINSINKLLLNPKLDNISGLLGQTGVTSLWGEAGTAKQIWNQISSQLQLQGATLAKGQGAVSDYERSIFKGAAVNASRGQSDAEFRKSLVNMRGALSLASGLKVPMKVTDPTTGEVREYTLDRDGVITAEKNGLMIEAVDNIVAN